MPTKHKLFLIDGNAVMYRAYYAIRHLSNSKGFPTNAIFGFLSSLRKIQAQEKPDYLAVVFDSKGPTFRHHIYKEYKATRKPMPDDLIPQVPKLKEVIRALNIPIFEEQGYEGDDILATLAVEAAKQNLEVAIVTNDKDLLQVVGPSVKLYHAAKDAYIDEQEVERLYGVSPERIKDIQSLWGDSVDNIPGVPGIGAKTATGLIQEFGSLENLLNNLDQIRNKRVKEKISKNLEQLETSRRLVTMHTDVPLSLSLENLKIKSPNRDQLIPLLQEFEFNSMLSEYIRSSPRTERKCVQLFHISQLKDLVARISQSGHCALDTETDSPSPTKARLVGMSFAVLPGEAFYLPLAHDYPDAPAQIPKAEAFDILRDIMFDPKIGKSGQNIKYDAIVLKREGLPIRGILHDSMVLSYLNQPNWGKHNLDNLAMTYLQEKTIPYNEVVGKGKNEITMNSVNIDEAAPYACQDAELTLRLCHFLWPLIQEQKMDDLYTRIERPLIEVLIEMETHGIRVNAGVLNDISTELEEIISRQKKIIFETCGEEFNLNSPQQLAVILFEKLKLPATKRTQKTRDYSTGLDVLQDLAANFPVAGNILEFRQLSKLKSTYADALPLLINPKTGRIHTSYNQTVAATGRLSSSDPNLQNIPARGAWGPRFRKAFVPGNGWLFLAADYSQIELRILAHLSSDPALIETFSKDRDIHSETAAQVFGEGDTLFAEESRRRAKIINFSIIYGTSAFSLAKELGTSNTEAQGFINRYFERYPKVAEYLERCVQQASEKGYSETLLGRRRSVPELRNTNRIAQQAGRRIALNNPIQGTAADLMKMAMIDIHREMQRLELKSKMILQVHDELVFEVPDDEHSVMEALVREKMETVMDLQVPLKVHMGFGVNWDDAK